MNFERARERMVEDQLRRRGITDPRVLGAMAKVPRHRFVDPSVRHLAYDDGPVPIGCEQTISQPYMVALMSELLRLEGRERVLEIGTGCGYQSAVLAELAARVYTVERIPALAEQARDRLMQLGYGDRIEFRVGDGSLGWEEAAPYDGEIVTAAAHQIPRPLIAQLGDGGYLVMPLGEMELQGLVRLHRSGDHLDSDYFGECRFVKLVGEYGWSQ